MCNIVEQIHTYKWRIAIGKRIIKLAPGNITAYEAFSNSMKSSLAGAR